MHSPPNSVFEGSTQTDFSFEVAKPAAAAPAAGAARATMVDAGVLAMPLVREVLAAPVVMAGDVAPVDAGDAMPAVYAAMQAGRGPLDYVPDGAGGRGLSSHLSRAALARLHKRGVTERPSAGAGGGGAAAGDDAGRPERSVDVETSDPLQVRALRACARVCVCLCVCLCV